LLTEPIVITVNTVPKSMPRVSVGNRQASYEMSDFTFKVDVKHVSFRVNKKARVKHTFVFGQRKIVPDALTSENDYETSSISVQIDRPEAGYTATELDHMWAGMKTYLTTALLTQIVGQES
jgi:hypothetical protein